MDRGQTLILIYLFVEGSVALMPHRDNENARHHMTEAGRGWSS
jgi:hypothetical protein